MNKDKIESWIKILTLIASVVAFVFTVTTWRQQILAQRAELFENKIKEFQDGSTLIARSILDGYAVCGNCINDSINLSDNEMISIASSRVGYSTDITLINLDEVLNERLPSSNVTNQRIRRSFDNLLDFFGKLDYYVDNGFMKEAEIKYFQYYFEKCASSKSIMKYVKRYSFKSFESLVKRLHLGIPK